MAPVPGSILSPLLVANERKKPAKKISERGVIIKRIMNERGVSMIEASKIVKAEGLY